MTANSEKIAIEEVKCQALADNAQKDLEEALPALEEAMRVRRPREGNGTQPSVSLKSLGTWEEEGVSVGSRLPPPPLKRLSRPLSCTALLPERVPLPRLWSL